MAASMKLKRKKYLFKKQQKEEVEEWEAVEEAESGNEKYVFEEQLVNEAEEELMKLREDEKFCEQFCIELAAKQDAKSASRTHKVLQTGFSRCKSKISAPPNTSVRNSRTMDGRRDGKNDKRGPAEIAASVHNILEQMKYGFNTMSNSIISKIDEMGKRVDELEKSINELKTEMGQEGFPAAVKLKVEPKSADGCA